MTDVEHAPVVGKRLLPITAMFVGWTCAVAAAAALCWFVAPLAGGCRESTAARQILAVLEDIGGECKTAAAERTHDLLTASSVVWSLGAAGISAATWTVARRRPCGLYPPIRP